jgi:hypothetical protein
VDVWGATELYLLHELAKALRATMTAASETIGGACPAHRPQILSIPPEQFGA